MQRVRAASVEVDGERAGSIAHGLVVLLGIGAKDTAMDGERLAAKIAGLHKELDWDTHGEGY